MKMLLIIAPTHVGNECQQWAQEYAGIFERAGFSCDLMVMPHSEDRKYVPMKLSKKTYSRIIAFEFTPPDEWNESGKVCWVPTAALDHLGSVDESVTCICHDLAGYETVLGRRAELTLHHVPFALPVEEAERIVLDETSTDSEGAEERRRVSSIGRRIEFEKAILYAVLSDPCPRKTPRIKGSRRILLAVVGADESWTRVALREASEFSAQAKASTFLVTSSLPSDVGHETISILESMSSMGIRWVHEDSLDDLDIDSAVIWHVREDPGLLAKVDALGVKVVSVSSPRGGFHRDVARFVRSWDSILEDHHHHLPADTDDELHGKIMSRLVAIAVGDPGAACGDIEVDSTMAVDDLARLLASERSCSDSERVFSVRWDDKDGSGSMDILRSTVTWSDYESRPEDVPNILESVGRVVLTSASHVGS